MTEPIERSMPPVMMTQPTPMAKMPSIATCRLVLVRLVAPKKSLLETPMTRHSATRAQNMPNSLRMRDASLQGGFRLLKRRGSPGHEFHDVVFAEFMLFQDPAQPALAENS